MGHPLTVGILGLITTLVGPEIILDCLSDAVETIYSSINHSVNSSFKYLCSVVSQTKDFVYSVVEDIADYFYTPSTTEPFPMDKVVPAVAEHLVNSGVKKPLVFVYHIEPQIHYHYK
jgi:hypothetical protein